MRGRLKRSLRGTLLGTLCVPTCTSNHIVIVVKDTSYLLLQRLKVLLRVARVHWTSGISRVVHVALSRGSQVVVSVVPNNHVVVGL